MTRSRQDKNPTAVCHTLVHDNLDLLGDRVIHSDGRERLQYWIAFYNIFKSLPFKDSDIDHRHDLCRLAVSMTLACKADEDLLAGLEMPFGDFSKIQEWTHGTWEEFQDLFKNVVGNLGRRSNRHQPDREDDVSGEPTIYQRKWEKLSRYIQLHQALSPIRQALEVQLDHQKLADDAFPKLASHAVSAFLDCKSQVEDQFVQGALESLLLEADEEHQEDPADFPKFHTLGTLRQLMRAKPFPFSIMYNRIQSTLRLWTREAFDTPALDRIYSSFSSNRAPPRPLKPDSNQEATLDETPGLASVGVIGKRAASTSGTPQANKRQRYRERENNFLSMKKTAVRLTFDKDVEQDSRQGDEFSGSDEEEGAANLTALPPRSRDMISRRVGASPPKSWKPSQQKSYKGRRRWSDTEKRAIIEGIKMKGVGRWAEIKKLYSVVLKNRTSGQIQDCYRTMKRKGELGDLE